MSTGHAKDPLVGVTHNRALCCDCGTARTWSRKAGLRRHFCSFTAEDIAEYEARHGHQWQGPEPYQRQLADMKCSTCKTITRHALIRDCVHPQYRDPEEAEDRAMIAPTEDPDKQRFLDEAARVQGFGIDIKYRDDTPYLVSGGVHFYDVEQYDDTKSFVIRLNPNLPWTLLLRALDEAWKTISDRHAYEAARWKQRSGHRSLYFSAPDRSLDACLQRSVTEAEKWARLWALGEAAR